MDYENLVQDIGNHLIFKKKLFTMINPINYLFYKIYKVLFFTNGGIVPVQQSGATALFPLLNFWTIWILVTGELTTVIMVVSLIFMLPLSIFYAASEKQIIIKYEKESEKSRIIGNWVVALYIIITIGAFFVVAFS